MVRHLKCIGESKSEPASGLPRVADEGETLKRVPTSSSLTSKLWCVFHHNHRKNSAVGEHVLSLSTIQHTPGVDEILDAIANRVNGMKTRLKAWVHISLVRPNLPYVRVIKGDKT